MNWLPHLKIAEIRIILKLIEKTYHLNGTALMSLIDLEEATGLTKSTVMYVTRDLLAKDMIQRQDGKFYFK